MPKKKKTAGNSNAVIVTFLLIASIVGAGGYFVWKDHVAKQATQAPASTKAKQATAAPLEGTLPQNGNVGFYGVGGGYLGAGLEGSYFYDANFQDKAFDRRDLRIDFDWQEHIKPGGSLPYTKLGKVPADNYSVRWEGQFIPRFSETYTFYAQADSVRIWIDGTPLIDHWPSSDANTYPAQEANISLEAGRTYDIRIDYREQTGPARMQLSWASPSTPLETIQSTAMVGTKPPQKGVIVADAVKAANGWGEYYGWGNDHPRKDGQLDLGENDWPAEDFNFVLRPIDKDLHHGTYRIEYTGSSAFEIRLNDAELFSADGTQSFGAKKTPDQGYDPATNKTALLAKVRYDRGLIYPTFTDTDRDGPVGSQYETNSGVTDISIQVPLSPGSEEYHPKDEIFARDAIEAFSDTLITFRWNDVNGSGDFGTVRTGEPSGEWADRMTWDHIDHNLKDPKGRRVKITNKNYEYKILLHNRIGKDPYLQIPHFATDDYIRKLAYLVRYGADKAGNPYTQPTADPYFPPLNPNLRLNLEFSNETPWNTAGQYPQGHWMRIEPENLRQAWVEDPNSPDGQRFAILNYDGAFPTDEDIAGFTPGKRFYALRTVEMSNIFREVFGDEAMPAPGKNDPRIRPLLMYQYDNANNTARDSLFFIDNYFNKTDPKSTYSGAPQPPNYFIYGAGAATYYASADAMGWDKSHPLTSQGLGGFEEPKLLNGRAAIAPKGLPWTFEGTAGIVAWPERTEAQYGPMPTADKGLDQKNVNWLGFKMTVGAEDVAVYEIGRYMHDSTNNSTTMYIVDAATGETIMKYDLNGRGAIPGENAWTRTGQKIFVMAGKSYNWPVILQAGKSYYVVGHFDENTPYAKDVPIQAPAGVRIDGSVAIETKRRGWSYDFVSAQEGNTPNRTYGPVNIKLATGPVVEPMGEGVLELGFLQESRNGIENRSRSLDEEYISRQTMFLAGTGAASTEITIPEPGIYALIYSMAHKRDQTPWTEAERDENTVNSIKIFADTGNGMQPITPAGQSDTRPDEGSTHGRGYWTKPGIGFDFFGSAPFSTTQPNQKVTIRFEGTGERLDQVVQLDDIALASSAVMTAGEIPSGGGFAEGAPDVSNWEARVMSMYRYAQAFGIKAISYEGGWYPGGDANKMPLQFQSSFFDPRMVTGEKNAISALARAGLTLNTDYTFDFAIPDYALGDAKDYSRMRAWAELNNQLPAEANNGLPLLSTLSHTSTSWSNQAEGAQLEAGGWMSWNVVAPASGVYKFKAYTTPGGTIQVHANEAVTILEGATGGTLENKEGIFLTKGLHNIRARALEGSFELTGLAGALPDQLYGPAGLEGQSAYRSVLLKWPEVAGADGYNIYYKTRTETEWTRYNDALKTGAGELYRIKGLEPDITHNFVATYVKDGKESAYSNQITAVPLIEAELLAWNFDDAKNRAVAEASERDILLKKSAIEMVGLPASSNGHMAKQAMGVSGVARENDFIIPGVDESKYYALKIEPEANATLGLKRLEFGVWSSDPVEEDPRQQNGFHAEVRWSTDGFRSYEVAPLSPSAPIKGYSNGNTNSGVPFSADLSGFPELQDTRQPVELRIYVYGELGLYNGIGKRGDNPDVVVIGGVSED